MRCAALTCDGRLCDLGAVVWLVDEHGDRVVTMCTTHALSIRDVQRRDDRAWTIESLERVDE